MRLDRAARTLTSWMAIVAILMVTFAPVISHALGAGASRSWFEVCTASKTAWVKASAFDTQQSPVEGSKAHFFEHCPYCALQADVVPVLPTLPKLSALPPVADELPAAFLHAPRTSHVWLSAQARAPPLSA